MSGGDLHTTQRKMLLKKSLMKKFVFCAVSLAFTMHMGVQAALYFTDAVEKHILLSLLFCWSTESVFSMPSSSEQKAILSQLKNDKKITEWQLNVYCYTSPMYPLPVNY